MLSASLRLIAQSDSLATDNAVIISSAQKDSVKLLPKKIFITQRVLWGEKGLMRNFDYFELNRPDRIREMKIRRYMLLSHQVIGYATLAGMVANGIVGARLYNGHSNMGDLHEGLSAAVNIGYFTSASLAFFAPPKFRDERKGFTKVKLHKVLSIVHLSSMIATNVLAGMLEDNPSLRPYHRGAAYLAFGSFAASIVVVKF